MPVTPVKTEPGQGLSALTQAVVRARNWVHQATPVLENHHLTLEEWLVLDVLASCDGAPMKDLAAATGASNATLSRHVDALARRGMIFREVAFNDRRKILIHLSRRGRSTHHRVTEDLDQDCPGFT